MKKLFTGLLGLLTLSASAQTAPGWVSAAMLPISPAFRAAPSFASDAAGNTYLAASFSQSVTLAPGTVLTSQGMQDGVVAKYDPAGNLLWYRQLGSSGNDALQKVILDASGKVTLLGLASDGAQFGTTTFTTTSFGAPLVLAQLDAQGRVQYVREVGNGSFLVPASLASDASGNYYVSGLFAFDATFGSFSFSTPISTTYGLDQFVLKVSAAGEVQWAQQGCRVLANANTANVYSHLVAEPGGNLYFVWTAPPSATTGFNGQALPASRGDYDGLVVKFSTQGTPQWTQRVGGTGADVSTYAGLDAAGRLVVPGFTAAAGSLSSASSASATTATTGFVTVLEPSAGNPVWSRDLAAMQAGGYRSVTSDVAGNIYLAGHFSGQAMLPGRTLTGSGGLDVLVVSYSPTGDLRWTQQSTGTGDEIPANIALDNSNRPMVAGLLTGIGRFGSTALTSSATATGTAVPFVAYLSGVTTATRTAVAAAPLGLYPNPASATTAVKLPMLPAGTELAFIDGLGRVARRAPAGPALSVAGLAPGLYVVQATAPSGEQWTSRLAVE